MSTAVAKNMMAEMKLLGMIDAFDQVLTDATRDQTSYTEFLDTLLQAEYDSRTSTSPLLDPSAKRKSRSSTACTGCARAVRCF
jgi:hypothetical protein